MHFPLLPPGVPTGDDFPFKGKVAHPALEHLFVNPVKTFLVSDLSSHIYKEETSGSSQYFTLRPVRGIRG